MHLPENDWTVYAWVVWLSWWGASVAYLQRIKSKGPNGFSWWVFFVELLTAGFVGYITFTLCELNAIDARTTSIVVAIAGHTGTRAIFIIRDRMGLSELRGEAKSE